MTTTQDITETVEYCQIAPHGGTEAMAKALVENRPIEYFTLVEQQVNTLPSSQFYALYNHGSRIFQQKEVDLSFLSQD